METKQTARTDPHRPSAIVPTDYVFQDGYVTYVKIHEDEDYSDMGVFDGLTEEELFRPSPLFSKSTYLKCDVCGASHKWGSLFLHQPTGQYVKMGHECARKYQMLGAWADAERTSKRKVKDRRGAALLKAKRRRDLRAWLASDVATPEVRRALRTDHYIIKDIRGKLIKWGSISEKQAALCVKITDDEALKRAENDVKLDKAPVVTGEKREIEGVVVSAKSQDGWGRGQVNYKMTIKVREADGYWLAWGTVPSAMFDDVPVGSNGQLQALKGCKVRLTGTFAVSDKDDGFTFYKRPTKAQILAYGPEARRVVAQEEKTLKEVEEIEKAEGKTSDWHRELARKMENFRRFL